MIRLIAQRSFLLLCLLPCLHAEVKPEEQQNKKEALKQDSEKKEKLEEAVALLEEEKIDSEKMKKDMKRLISEMSSMRSKLKKKHAEINNLPLESYGLLIEKVKEHNKNSSGKIFMTKRQKKQLSMDELQVSVSGYDAAKRIADVVIKNPKYKMPILQKWSYSGNTWTPHYSNSLIAKIPKR